MFKIYAEEMLASSCNTFKDFENASPRLNVSEIIVIEHHSLTSL